ncbi:MAG: GGDEF domain-containing protein [Gammaproteobacteria bacterium]|nr:GGDEF domain-containing protein [Gammaproteobacteria bacterium]
MADEKNKKEGKEPEGSGGSEVGATTHVDSDEIKASRAYEERGKQAILTVIAGVQTGLTVPFNGVTLTGGRDPECDLPLVGRGISRTHFLIEPRQDRALVISDLGSTNGIYVNGEKVQQHLLKEGDRIHIGPETVLKFGIEDVTDVRIRVRQYEESIRDDLTGIFNRRYFMSTLKHELAFCQRHDDHVSVILFDVDDFKRVNDQHGHPAGDIVIKRLADGLTDHLRTEDVLARYGGEEFAVILRGQDELRALQTAERIRNFVEQLKIDLEGTEMSLTVSLGTSTLRSGGPGSVEEMMEEADRNLYEAKAQGKNRTVGTIKDQ